MNVLYLSNDDTGGNSYYTMRAVNETTGHQARAVKLMKSYLNYPTDIFQPNPRRLQKLYKWADVIHIRNYWSALPPGFEGKPVVVTFTNVSYRKRPDHFTSICLNKGWTVTVSTLDLVKHNGMEWLPNPREDRLGQERHDVFTVAHSPTKRERKGTEQIIAALDGLKDVRLELIEQTPYAECLRRRAKCHATIDQFAHGYGNSAIEAWAFGQAVISHSALSPEVPGLIRDELGELPWLDTPKDVGRIRDAVLLLKEDQAEYDRLVAAGRKWYDRHHTFPSVAKRAVELYGMTRNGY